MNQPTLVGASSALSVPASPLGAVALVGPGRAGTAVAIALAAAGHAIVAVAGRELAAPSTRAVATRFGAETRTVAAAGAGADLVILAVPDAMLEPVAAEVAPGLAPGALVVHLAGSRGLDALAAIRTARPDVAVGAMHPLQTFAEPDSGAAVLAGSWAAVAGPASVTDLAIELGLIPFVVADEDRARYHAAAAIASNHLVALLAQVERVAAEAGVPGVAFLPLARAALANVEAFGPAAALTGPVARGDVATVERHLDALGATDRTLYRALAREALRLSGRDDADLASYLDAEPTAGPKVGRPS